MTSAALQVGQALLQGWQPSFPLNLVNISSSREEKRRSLTLHLTLSLGKHPAHAPLAACPFPLQCPTAPLPRQGQLLLFGAHGFEGATVFYKKEKAEKGTYPRGLPVPSELALDPAITPL